jgi:large subunit ribosomal protein L25
MSTKLKIATRVGNKKAEIKRLRREGQIPAVIYSQGKEGEVVSVDASEFAAILRTVEQGGLPTTIFHLAADKGKERRAIIKGIQYHVTTYAVIHIDFEELHDDVMVKVKVPLDCVGAAESAGAKLGGSLRQVMRHMKVRCLPKNIPTRLQLDVRELGIQQSIRLKSLTIPEGVNPIDSLEEIAAVMTKR